MTFKLQQKMAIQYKIGHDFKDKATSKTLTMDIIKAKHRHRHHHHQQQQIIITRC